MFKYSFKSRKKRWKLYIFVKTCGNYNSIECYFYSQTYAVALFVPQNHYPRRCLKSYWQIECCCCYLLVEMM